MGSQTGKDSTTRELKRIREREIDLRRLNGELACKECRRTKTACDKKVPCATCIDRDCPDICPVGTILNPRYEKPASRDALLLKDGAPGIRLGKLQAMHDRISALEDALDLQTGGGHPLLTDALVRIKRCEEVTRESVKEPSCCAEDEDILVSSFGTLSVGNSAMHYIGPSSIEIAVREGRQANQIFQHGVNFFESTLPADLLQASDFFPFVPACFARPSTYASILAHLPSYARATGLVEAYFTNLSWYMTPITRAQAQTDLLPLFYPARQVLDPSRFDATQLHALGLLCALLALGAVADLTQRAVNAEAEALERLARAALGMRSVVEHGSLEACQALVLLGSYEAFTDRKKREQAASALIVCGLKIGLSIGLHLDPDRWGLEHRIAERRRWVFWQLNTLDKMRSSENRHPPVFKPNTIDCKFPEDSLATVASGDIVESIWRWRHRFARDSLTPLCELLCDARPVRYIRILELGAWLQAQRPHPFAVLMPWERPAMVCEPAAYTEDDLHRAIHPVISVWWKQISIQKLHRVCFARAIIENPANPYQSVYAPSFLATFYSTRILLKLVLRSYDASNLVLRRLHSIWGSAAVSGIIVGVIACHVKVQACRDEAHELLEQLVALFEKASPELSVPAETLPALRTLLARSKAAYAADAQGAPQLQNVQLNRRIPVLDVREVYRDAEDALLMLAGHDARVISHGNAPRNAQMPALDLESHPLPFSLVSLTSSTPSPNIHAQAQDSQDPGVRRPPQASPQPNPITQARLPHPDPTKSASSSVSEVANANSEDKLAWLAEHEKDEAEISMRSALAQERCGARRAGLKAAGVDAAPPPFLHGPTYLDLESVKLYGVGDLEVGNNGDGGSGLVPGDGHDYDGDGDGWRDGVPAEAGQTRDPGRSTLVSSSTPLDLQESGDIFSRLLREVGIIDFGAFEMNDVFPV